MRRQLRLMAPGALWGVAGVILLSLFRMTPDVILAGRIGSSPHVGTLELLSADNASALWKVLVLPAAVGIDLLLWSVGIIPWLIIRQGWPGSALGSVLAPYPLLAWIMVLIFAALPGAAASWAIGAFFQSVNRKLGSE